MTPQESQLVSELFDRLAKLETAPRDPAAERLIADGLQRAPHAVYALVQTALLQDEALRRANARIEELQAQAGGAEAPEQRPASFLDSMREMFSPREPHGSVPNVRAGGPAGGTMSQGLQSQGFQPQGGPQQGYPPQAYAGASPFGGGSFLGTAASTAAGVLGGALLLDGIRSMFGHQFGSASAAPSAFGNLRDERASPWGRSAGSAADSQLARDLGIDRIGDRGRDSGNEQTDPSAADAGSFQTADAEDTQDDFFDDGGFGGDDGDFSDDSYDV